MPNFISNRIVLIGSPEEVEAFVAAARGPANALIGNFLTEMSIVKAVRSGTPVAEAFRDANVRVDALVDRDAGIPAPPSVAIQAVSEEEFEDWAADIEVAVERDAAHAAGEAATSSHLSLPTLIPIPAEILGESYRLGAYHWCTENWGVKAGLEAATAPRVSMLPDGKAMATFDEVVSVNSPPIEAMRSISEAFPGLVAACAWVGEIQTFGCVIYRGGEDLVRTQMAEGDLSPDCFEIDNEGEEDEMRFLLHEKALGFLFYDAITAVDLEPPAGPSAP